MKEQINQASEKMEKCIKSLQHEFSTVRAGRANPAVLDKISVDYYGAPTPISQMAAISVPEARVLLIQPWDASSLKLIEKAIYASDLGITPSNDGKSLRIAFPQLTEDRRKELVKQIKKFGEEAKVTIRSIRRDTLEKFKAMKKSGELTEDEQTTAEKDAQKITDKFCEKVDEAITVKEKEIMSI
ncbi:MAG: ribosome recycling factor [Oscillospiraceae bacterium]